MREPRRISCAAPLISPLQVRVTREGHTVGGTSIMGLMMLAAGQGHTILIEVEGPEAAAALEALIKLVEFGLRRRGLVLSPLATPPEAFWRREGPACRSPR